MESKLESAKKEVFQCHSNRDAVEQLQKSSPDTESIEQRLVRFNFLRPSISHGLLISSHEEDWLVTKRNKSLISIQSKAMVVLIKWSFAKMELKFSLVAVDRNLEVCCHFEGPVAINNSLSELLKIDHARVIDTSYVSISGSASLIEDLLATCVRCKSLRWQLLVHRMTAAVHSHTKLFLETLLWRLRILVDSQKLHLDSGISGSLGSSRVKEAISEDQCTELKEGAGAGCNQCETHLKEIEKLKKELSHRDEEISSLNKLIVNLVRKQGL
ncbi:hypothetical protein HAX54_031429 [Datura stramonium]|uniref:Uncharacterized protein n=1 Tax=Datura stramonium TaxID=4076 RepID=A0ABS8V9N7_DATST|nr:hypothetical protein [Datura stramonium]